jgi:type 1 fimbria pilin
MNKFTALSLVVSGLLAASVAQASDGQIQLNGQILNQTCAVAIDGSPTGNSTITLDGVPASELTVPLETMSGAALKGSDVIKNVQISLEGCTLPAGKNTVGVSFDTTGYGQNT